MTPLADPRLEASLPRILVVEDEVLIRTVLAERLREEGVTVIEAANADEAWSYLAAGGEADLVFSDLHMPGSMGGVQFAERLRNHGRAVPIILTSGNPGREDFTRLGPFLQKPYKFSQLISLIGTLLKLPPRNEYQP